MNPDRVHKRQTWSVFVLRYNWLNFRYLTFRSLTICLLMGWRLSVERKIHIKNVVERERILSMQQQAGIGGRSPNPLTECLK